MAGTVQEKLPSLAVDETIIDQPEPLSVEYSIMTLPTVPVEDQVTLCVEPAVHISLPLGEITVIVLVVPPCKAAPELGFIINEDSSTASKSEPLTL